MTEEEYIQDRLEDQLKWYDKKSSFNQRMFKRLVVIEILFSITIPFLTSFSSDEKPEIKIIIGTMGITIALIAGLLSLYKFQENWINYRTTAETLKKEKYQYLTKSGVYNNKKETEVFNLLVLRVEAIISTENTHWQHKVQDKE